MSKQSAEVLKQQQQPSNDDTLSRVLNDFADNMSEEVSQGVAATANARGSMNGIISASQSAAADVDYPNTY